MRTIFILKTLLVYIIFFTTNVFGNAWKCTGNNLEEDGIQLNIQTCTFINLNWSKYGKELANNDFLFPAHYFDLSYNEFDSEIPGTAFGPFTELRTLNLSNNQINSIQASSFHTIGGSPLNKLENIFMNSNHFEKIPWKSLLDLPELQLVDLSNNHIKRFDRGDLIQEELDKFTNRIKLAEINLSNCQIEFVDSNVLNLFASLKILDLSSNYIKHISPSFGSSIDAKFAFDFKQLHLKSNRLVCDCELAWLKNFLKSRQYTKETQCIMEKKDEPKDQHFVILSNYEYFLLDENSSENENLSYRVGNDQLVVDLIRDDFSCNYKTIANIATKKQDKSLEFKCSIDSYPNAEIKWISNHLDLERLLGPSDNRYRSIRIESESSINKISNIRQFSSTLYLTFLNGRDGMLRENFSCISFFNQESKSPIETVLFEIRGNLDAVLTKYDYLGRDHDERFFLLGGNRLLGKVPFIYWIILAIAILFIISVILFVTVMIIRANRKFNRQKRMLSKRGEGEYYYTHTNTMNKNSAIYMRSSMDRTLTQPLRPIIIREHRGGDGGSSTNTTPTQDYSSIYSDVNLPKNFSLSTTLTSANSNNNRRVVGGSGVRMMPHDQSFDQDPINTSFLSKMRQHPLDDCSSSISSSSNSSKLFEENFEEYQDPKFDDLRKPPHNYSQRKSSSQ
jgi:hypothetical protein